MTGPVESCAHCGHGVEPRPAHLLHDGFSASGARPAVYAHPACRPDRRAAGARWQALYALAVLALAALLAYAVLAR